MKSIHALATGLLLTMAMSSTIAAMPTPSPETKVTNAESANRPMNEGEIRKIDKDAGKLTIKHGPLTTLDMPAMTMVFRVKEETMLDQVKVGDKIRFVAERANGALTVTEITQQ